MQEERQEVVANIGFRPKEVDEIVAEDESGHKYHVPRTAFTINGVGALGRIGIALGLLTGTGGLAIGGLNLYREEQLKNRYEQEIPPDLAERINHFEEELKGLQENLSVTSGGASDIEGLKNRINDLEERDLTTLAFQCTLIESSLQSRGQAQDGLGVLDCLQILDAISSHFVQEQQNLPQTP